MSCSRRSTARSCCLGKSGGWGWVAQNVERKLRNFLGHKFWARGYFVSTVGRDEEMIRAYIKNQEMADKQLDQLQLKLATS
jgi:putative transposase